MSGYLRVTFIQWLDKAWGSKVPISSSFEIVLYIFSCSRSSHRMIYNSNSSMTDVCSGYSWDYLPIHFLLSNFRKAEYVFWGIWPMPDLNTTFDVCVYLTADDKIYCLYKLLHCIFSNFVNSTNKCLKHIKLLWLILVSN